ncbi:MAG: hypothetical protein AB1500_06935 [Bacillota bacterium]
MLRLKKVLGYAVATLAVPLIMATFIGMDTWTHGLVSVTGITVSPWFTGGEVIRTIEHGRYRTTLHRPVFDGLLGERKQGFVQVDWSPPEALPEYVCEDVDYDGDGFRDFSVKINTRTCAATLMPCGPTVISLEGSYRLKDALAVRVLLRGREWPREAR